MSPILFLFFKEVMVILGPLNFHVNFGISLSILSKQPKDSEYYIGGEMASKQY